MFSRFDMQSGLLDFTAWLGAAIGIYQYFNSTFGSNVGGSEPFLDFCPVYNGFANGLCKDSGNQLLLQVNQIEEFGAKNSRCVGGILGQQKTSIMFIHCLRHRGPHATGQGPWEVASVQE
jgi:hypothetical protein